MEIGRKDVIWNFAATFMRVASGLIVLPLVLRLLSKEEYALWSIFLVVGSIVTLLDFGFSNAFSRNITYIFSGVKVLKADGYVPVDSNDKDISYGLLRSVISAMRRYYGYLALFFTFIFIVASPFYLSDILKSYNGDKQEIWISWFIYGFLIAYQLYTYYYGAILMGRGMVKRYQQIVVIGQTARIATIVILLMLDTGIISLVIGQLVGDILNRTLCYQAFFDKNLKQHIRESESKGDIKEIMKIMFPNAFKIGLTTLGGFFVSKGVALISAMYLTLPEIGSYGVTKQIMDLIGSLGILWFGTYYPKITLHRVNNDRVQMKRMYIKGKLSLLLVFIICGLGTIFVLPYFFQFINSKTNLLPSFTIFIFLIVSFLETNHGLSAHMLLTKNEVPFAKASIISGLATVVLLFIGLKLTNLGIWSMILAPGLVQISYQNWKWPLTAAKDLGLKFKDYPNGIFSTINSLKSETAIKK